MPNPDDVIHDGVIEYEGSFYYDGSTERRLREFEAEFDVEGMRYRNSSITARPDAVSSDYLTAFTFGPEDQGDSSLGAVSRLWRVRVDGHKVFLARTNGNI